MGAFSGVKLFLLDMDGTFYLGGRLLPGAKEFLAACRAKGVRYMFLTNNSSQSAQDYRARLRAMGVEAWEEEIFTSADATLLYLAQHAFPKEILLVGTASLHAQFAQAGYTITGTGARAVVLGFDTAIHYAKLTALCDAVRAGLPYVATHPDYNCPVPGGFIPDVGAVIAFVQAATGRLPDVVVGKPNGHIARAAAQKAGVAVGEMCMVGDRLYTDIALGAAGVRTALVLCGETDRAALAESALRPDGVYENLAEMAALLAQEG